jgi:nucleotide-binding universal stress UspA family protein
VTLFHVVPEGLPPSERRRAQQDAERLLRDEARHLREKLPRGVRVEALVKTGSAAREIAAQATDDDAELIVMGRGGGNPLREEFLGSTAERVIRSSKRPVLVVRLAARAPYARPSLALSPDEAAHGAVRFMLRLLPRPRPQVQVIHAYDMPFRGFVYPSLSRDEAEDRKELLRGEATREIAKVLADALHKAGVPAGDGPSFKTYVRYGSAREVVERALAKSDADLLVLGTKGHSGPAYVLLGTVAGNLLRATRCDVLVVPPGRSPKHRRSQSSA